jgi:hypothetical protein
VAKFTPGTPKHPASGRKPGVVNKATADIKALAQVHGAEAIATLAKLMREGVHEKTRMAAASALLDRGYGRAAQSIDVSNSDGTLQKMDDATLDAEIQRYMAQATARLKA